MVTRHLTFEEAPHVCQMCKPPKKYVTEKKIQEHFRRSHPREEPRRGGTGIPFQLSERYATVVLEEPTKNKEALDLMNQVLITQLTDEQRKIMERMQRMLGMDTLPKGAEAAPPSPKAAAEAPKAAPPSKKRKSALEALEEAEGLAVHPDPKEMEALIAEMDTSPAVSPLTTPVKATSSPAKIRSPPHKIRRITWSPNVVSPEGGNQEEDDPDSQGGRLQPSDPEKIYIPRQSPLEEKESGKREEVEVPVWTVADIVHQTVDGLSSTISTMLKPREVAPQALLNNSLLATMDANINVTNGYLKRVTEAVEAQRNGRKIVEAVDRLSGHLEGFRSVVRENSRIQEQFLGVVRDLRQSTQEQAGALKSIMTAQLEATRMVSAEMRSQTEAFRAITSRFNGLVEDERRGGKVPRMIRRIITVNPQEKEEFEAAWRQRDQAQVSDRVKFGPPIQKRPAKDN